jgi:hypothetical protein
MRMMRSVVESEEAAVLLVHSKTQKKAGVVKRPQAFNHVGLLLNEPPREPSCSLCSHPTTSTDLHPQSRVQVDRRSTDRLIVQRHEGKTSRLSSLFRGSDLRSPLDCLSERIAKAIARFRTERA